MSEPTDPICQNNRFCLKLKNKASDIPLLQVVLVMSQPGPGYPSPGAPVYTQPPTPGHPYPPAGAYPLSYPPAGAYSPSYPPAGAYPPAGFPAQGPPQQGHTEGYVGGGIVPGGYPPTRAPDCPPGLEYLLSIGTTI